jgi:UDP-glucose 4-epimerase
MSFRNILVVGGAGYIGSHVAKSLFKIGYNPIVFDNLVYGHKDLIKWGDFIEADLSDTQSITKVFNHYQIKAVMHFSAYTNVGESVGNPSKYYFNNVVNTLGLLERMLTNQVKYFIFSSSAAVYGNPVGVPISEDHPKDPINPYGWTKLIVEQILSDFSYAYGLKYVSLRYFNAAGADPEGETGEDHNPETHLIPIILDVALGKREYVEIFGTDYETPDGTCIRDYIHVMDLADAHILALENLLNVGKGSILNLGNGKGFSVKEVIQVASKITGKKIKVIEG